MADREKCYLLRKKWRPGEGSVPSAVEKMWNSGRGLTNLKVEIDLAKITCAVSSVLASLSRKEVEFWGFTYGGQAYVDLGVGYNLFFLCLWEVAPVSLTQLLRHWDAQPEVMGSTPASAFIVLAEGKKERNAPASNCLPVLITPRALNCIGWAA